MIVTLVGGPSDPSSCQAASSGDIFCETCKMSLVSKRDLKIQNVKRDVTWPAGARTILGFAPPVAAFIAAFAAFA